VKIKAIRTIKDTVRIDYYGKFTEFVCFSSEIEAKKHSEKLIKNEKAKH
jgi:hypothetical protein